MSVTIPDFWKLVVDSQLLSDDQCRQLNAGFGQVKGAVQQDGARPLVEWLVSQNALSRYQTEVLLRGKAGPFCYGDYKIYDRIGSGRLTGMYRAAHAPTGHPVLLQFLSGVVAEDPQVWANVVQRTIALAGVSHGNLVKYYEPIDLTTYRLLALEDLRGRSVEARLAQEGPLKIGEACAVLRLALQGLAQLHRLGAAHGDLRPANLWIGASGNVKLLFDPYQSSTQLDYRKPDASGLAAARADYLAPELARPGRAPSALSDIYAVGCTLYQMLTGKPPFAGGDVAQKLSRHASEAIQPLEPFGVPAAAAEIVAYMMAKNAGVRYQTLAEVDQQLAALADAGRMNVQPAPLAATLPAYEQWVREKQAALGVTTAQRDARPALDALPEIGAARAADSAPRISIGADTGGEAAVGNSAASKYRAARPRKKNSMILALVGAGAAAAALAAIVFVLASGNRSVGPPPGEQVAANNNSGGDGGSTSGGGDSNTGGGATNVQDNGGTANGTEAAAAPQAQIVADDGQLLWASPTSGAAIDLSHLPQGAQIFIAARPADLLSTSDGDKVLRALGPAFDDARQRFEQAAGIPLAEVEQLIVGLYANEGRMPRAVLVVRPVVEMSGDDLRARWRNPQPVDGASGKYYTGGGWSYYLPDETGGGLFVMGAADDIEAAAALKGAAPALRREVEQLRKSSDVDRHLSILFAPNFLFSDGRELFSGDREKLLEPLDWLLGDGLQAGLASLHFGDAFYVEVRMVGDADLNEMDLAEALQNRLQEMPDRLEQYIIRLDPAAYWRAVAFAYPSMIRAFHRQTRVGAESDQAIVNSALPGIAAHNLIFGGEMVLASTPGAPAASAGPPPPAGPQTIDEALETKLSLSFDQTSLEFAMASLEEAMKTKLGDAPVDFRVVIIGTDLQKDGITRNQQIRDFAEEDKTAAEILTALVRRANPVTTVEDPSEVDQKLVWVVGPDPDDAAKRIVLITTRTAAAAKEYTLPGVFVPK